MTAPIIAAVFVASFFCAIGACVTYYHRQEGFFLMMAIAMMLVVFPLSFGGLIIVTLRLLKLIDQ